MMSLDEIFINLDIYSMKSPMDEIFILFYSNFMVTCPIISRVDGAIRWNSASGGMRATKPLLWLFSLGFAGMNHLMSDMRMSSLDFAKPWFMN